MKKSLFILSAVVLLVAVAAFLNVPSAFATTIDPDPVGCEVYAGGNWVVTGENTGKCVFAPSHKYSQNSCPTGYSLIDSFKFINYSKKFDELTNTNDKGDQYGWVYTGSKCKIGYSTTSQRKTDVAFGKPVDAWNGNCGAFISNPPVNGSVTVTKVTMPAGPNHQNICKVNYSDFEGNSMAKFGSPGWVYYNLNAETSQLWNNGQLNMYIYQNDAWQTCSNPLFVDAGEFGRVACYAENPIYFGIGTAINDTNSITSPLWNNKNN
jgi:hypothetical protein